jgi:hypothetical protein
MAQGDLCPAHRNDNRTPAKILNNLHNDSNGETHRCHPADPSRPAEQASDGPACSAFEVRQWTYVGMLIRNGCNSSVGKQESTVSTIWHTGSLSVLDIWLLSNIVNPIRNRH